MAGFGHHFTICLQPTPFSSRHCWIWWRAIGSTDDVKMGGKGWYFFEPMVQLSNTHLVVLRITIFNPHPWLQQKCVSLTHAPLWCDIVKKHIDMRICTDGNVEHRCVIAATPKPHHHIPKGETVHHHPFIAVCKTPCRCPADLVKTDHGLIHVASSSWSATVGLAVVNH